MSQFFVNSSGGGGGGVTALVPDVGGNVTGTNIPVQGYLAGSSQVVETYKNGSALQIADQTFMTRYVVDPSTTPGLKGTYQTIGAAITQAAADGWSILTIGICTILIRAGSYTENIAFPANFAANLIGLSLNGLNTNTSDVLINGDITLASQDYILLQNIAINPSGTDGVTIPNGIFGCTLCNCTIVAGSNSCVNFTGAMGTTVAIGSEFLGAIKSTNTSTAGSLSSGALFYNCSIQGTSSLDGSGAASFYNCQMPGMTLSTTSEVGYFDCQCTGGITGTSTGTCVIYNSQRINGGIFFNFSGTVNYSNCTVSGGGSLYTAAQLKAYQASSQGNIINSTTTATDYVVLYSDYYIGVTSTAAARAITLPDPATIAVDQSFIVKDQSGAASTHAITLTPAAGTIDGAASKAINTNYGFLAIKSDGTNYFTF